ncbi:hypothetical protein EW146_g6256 [Bondarzewia mesenterica]|uniref:DUF6535 domain-containing protein n=1 Tax=Bondarzewia mesenterica TaxID=1095465 RepID=A0A4S4LUU1_9AGAM|nr:hypothetical protein EW146_g6256 [Bondarzewia mesenterica]
MPALNPFEQAALYSAVVTAFLIESYKWLSENPTDLSAVLLTRISIQLANLSGQNSSTSMPLPALQPAFAPSSSQIAINVLWFTSLILSLNSVLTAILVKQWLVEYTRNVGANVISPRRTVALRQLRFESLRKWRIPDTIDYLPLQLVVALLLFFSGLVVLLWTLNHTVAGVATAFVGLSVLYFCITSILPSFFPTCLYRSAQSWIFYWFVTFIRRCLDRSGRVLAPTLGWTDFALHYLSRSHSQKYDVRALHWIHSSLTSWDTSLAHAVWKCANGLDADDTVQTLCTLYLQSAEYTVGAGLALTEQHVQAWHNIFGHDRFNKMYDVLLNKFPVSPADLSPTAYSRAVEHVRIFSSLHLVTERFSHWGPPAASLAHGLVHLINLLVVNDQRLQWLTEYDRVLVLETLVALMSKKRALVRGIMDEVEEKDIPLTMLSKILASALSSSRSSSDTNCATFPLLSAVAIGLSRCLSKSQFAQASEKFRELLDAMAVFVTLHAGGSASVGLRDALESWLPTLSRYKDESLLDVWDVNEPLVRSMRSFLTAVDRVIALGPLDLRKGVSFDALRMLFGTPSEICQTYLQRANRAASSGDLFAAEHVKCKKDLAQVELRHVLGVLFDALPATSWVTSSPSERINDANHVGIYCSLVPVVWPCDKYSSQIGRPTGVIRRMNHLVELLMHAEDTILLLPKDAQSILKTSILSALVHLATNFGEVAVVGGLNSKSQKKNTSLRSLISCAAAQYTPSRPDIWDDSFSTFISSAAVKLSGSLDSDYRSDTQTIRTELRPLLGAMSSFVSSREAHAQTAISGWISMISDSGYGNVIWQLSPSGSENEGDDDEGEDPKKGFVRDFWLLLMTIRHDGGPESWKRDQRRAFAKVWRWSVRADGDDDDGSQSESETSVGESGSSSSSLSG